MPTIHSDQLHVENWKGSLPVIVTLAPASNSSPSPPPPVHALIPRHSFLHVALAPAIRRLHQFAPPSFLRLGDRTLKLEEPAAGTVYQEDSDDDNNVGEDVGHKDAKVTKESGAASSGHAAHTSTPSSPSRHTADIIAATSALPVCWFEDEVTQTPLRWHLFIGLLFDLQKAPPESSIPWRLRLHFTAYPTDRILPLEQGTGTTRETTACAVLQQVRAVFQNSLKQAMCLHYGNSRHALNLTKDRHNKIWESLRTANYALYQQAHHGLPKQASTWVPVRVLVDDGGPPVQRPCRGAGNHKSHPGTTNDDSSSHSRLGNVLHAAVPALFDAQGRPTEAVVDWIVAGLRRPPLDAPVQNYWANLAHPDHFLYIIVSTKNV